VEAEGEPREKRKLQSFPGDVSDSGERLSFISRITLSAKGLGSAVENSHGECIAYDE